MIANHLKMSFRNLAKHKVYSGINVAGLSIGMAGAIIIFQLLSYHLGVDRYHRKAERTYRVVVDLRLEDGTVEQEKGSAYVLHQTLKKDFSYVKDAAYLAHRELTIVLGKNKNIKKFLEKENAAFTNPDFFQVFDYKWLAGKASVLDAPNQAVISKRYAQKYFGNMNPVGQTFRVNNRENVLVAGLIEDYPENTDFKKDIFISLPTLKKLVPDYGYDDWGWIDSNRETYITLPSPQYKSVFEKQMPAFSSKYYGADGKVFHYHLVDLADVHFNIAYGGKIKYSTVGILAGVGLLLILIACFNFVNLSTAQAFKRSKEIGVRKVLGVSQRQVFWLFIQEAGIYTVLSGLLAILLSMIFLPVLNNWLNMNLYIDFLGGLQLPVFILSLLIFIVMLAGVYPAIVISNFNPVRAVKGLLRQNNNNFFSVRKTLVIAQFSISFVLIAVAMVIVLQSEYMKSKDLGMSKDLILHVNLPETQTEKTKVLKNELMQLKEVEDVSFFRVPPSAQGSSGGSIKFENRDWEKFVARSRIADENYRNTYGLKLLAGRNITASDTLRECLINQKLVRSLGLKSPEEALGKRLLVGDIGGTGVIVGVLTDFNNGDLYTGIEPTVIFSSRKLYRYAGIKLKNLNPALIQRVSAIWQAQFPDDVFQHSFYDEDIAKFYAREELASRLTLVFAGLSVFLSCLGLFGLAIFSIGQRTKEIGVRKVLGASVASITTLLSFDFLKLVLVAVVIASPVAYYFMDKWLQDFAFKIKIEWWIFALAGLLAAGVAMLTISFQSIKAALLDPVKTLRSE